MSYYLTAFEAQWWCKAHPIYVPSYTEPLKELPEDMTELYGNNMRPVFAVRVTLKDHPGNRYTVRW